MRTLLLISRYFPPVYDVGGKRAFRLARYLPEHGWRVVVLTGRLPRDRPVDPTPVRLPSTTRVVRELEPSWWRRGERLSDGTIGKPVVERSGNRRGRGGSGDGGDGSGDESGRRSRLTDQVRIPVGADLVLAPLATARARRLAGNEGADAILASGGPPSTLVFGALARRVTGLPLCLDLRDPWSLGFLQRRRAAWIRRIESRLEARLFQVADRVSFSCESAADAYARLYPDLAHRFAAVLTGYDPDDVVGDSLGRRPGRNSRIRSPEDGSAGMSAKGERRDAVTLIHFGNCYGPRRLETVLRAVARVRSRRGLDRDAFRILNLGRPRRADLELARRLGLGERFVHEPVLPYREGLDRLARADLQLLVSYGGETLYVPAKLFDYLISGAPVLAVAPRSELTGIVERCGIGTWVEPGDVDGASRALERVIDVRAGRSLPWSRDAGAIAELSARQAAGRFAELLDRMVSSSGSPGRATPRVSGEGS